MTESGQLDLVDALGDQLDTMDAGLNGFEDLVNPAIDENPEDKLLMELLDHVSDVRQSLEAVRELLQTIDQRDREKEL